MRNYLLISFFLGFTIYCGFISCQNKKVTNNQTKIRLADTLLTKLISFPKSLRPLELNPSHLNFDGDEIPVGKKMISIIDGSCMACITDQLNAQDSLFNLLVKDSSCKIIFILNLKKADSVNFMLNLKPAIKAKGLILVDGDYSFERSNHLITEYATLRTFLVNEANQIECYGNPLVDSTRISAYKNLLR